MGEPTSEELYDMYLGQLEIALCHDSADEIRMLLSNAQSDGLDPRRLYEEARPAVPERMGPPPSYDEVCPAS